MNNHFNPSRGSEMEKNRTSFGYVTRLKSLPIPTESMKNIVVFSEDDGRFYRCVCVGDNYVWEAQTAGPHRTYLIPVKKLPEDVLTNSQSEHPSFNNCFDAIISAINEIAMGLRRFGIVVDPLCYKKCSDKVYQEETTYYIWNIDYDQEHLDIKPQFIVDPDKQTGESIVKNVYVQIKEPETITTTDIVVKYNEIVDILNVNHAGLVHASEEHSLFEICRLINFAIDEINPFARPFDRLNNRMDTVESKGSQTNPLNSPIYFKVEDKLVKMSFTITGTKVTANYSLS